MRHYRGVRSTGATGAGAPPTKFNLLIILLLDHVIQTHQLRCCASRYHRPTLTIISDSDGETKAMDLQQRGIQKDATCNEHSDSSSHSISGNDAYGDERPEGEAEDTKNGSISTSIYRNRKY